MYKNLLEDNYCYMKVYFNNSCKICRSEINLYKKEKLQYDQKKVQEYFPLEKLLPNLLGTFEEIFHLHIEEVELEAEKTWHESVKCYGVYDKQTNEKGDLIGHFYVDLYPREGKYGHAAAFTLKQAYIPYSEEDICKDRSTPISAMVCNFTRPTKDKPSLLTFGELINQNLYLLKTLFGQTNTSMQEQLI